MIDAVSSAPHYRSHLLPIWEALPPKVRGERFDLDVGGRPKGPRPNPARAVLVASGRDMGHAFNRGYRRIALMEHGIGQSYAGMTNGGYPGGDGRGIVNLFLSPNETAAARDRAIYPKARIEVIGDPVLDTLHRGLASVPGLPIVAISFHWNWTRLPELQTAAPYYLSALAGLAEEFSVIGHGHPRMIDRLAPTYRNLGIEVVESFDEVCRRADVYACDNSSSIYEFASTGRPVVLLNAPWFRRDVEHGLRFWAAAGVGRQVNDPQHLAEAIRCSLSEPPLSTVDPALRLAYSFTTGAAERGASILADWA